MVTKEMAKQSIRLAENVALLSLLDNVPQPPPSYFTAPIADGPEATRTLSLGDESTLASGLVFIAGISKQPNHVAAVCVEESPEEEGLTIRLAINEQLVAGEDLLDTLKCGLQEIFQVFARVSAGL